MSTPSSSANALSKKEFVEYHLKKLDDEIKSYSDVQLMTMVLTKLSNLPKDVLRDLLLSPSVSKVESVMSAPQVDRVILKAKRRQVKSQDVKEDEGTSAELEVTSSTDPKLQNVPTCSKQPLQDVMQTKKAAANTNVVTSNGKQSKKQSEKQDHKTLETQLNNLKLGTASDAQKQKPTPAPMPEKKKNGKKKNPTPNSTAQKVSANCEKCSRTSKRCDDVTSDLKTAQNEIKKLKKRLAVFEGPEEQQNGRKSWFDLEKELAEGKKRKEEMENENAKFAAKVREMEMELERNRSKISELTTYNAEKDNAIRILKANSQSDVMKQISSSQRLSLEMRKVLLEIQGKQDNLLAEDLLYKASKTVTSLKQKCDNPEIREQADYELLVFRRSFFAYQTAVEKNIKKIQADPFITQLELVELPEFPVLSDWLQEALETAQAEFNKKIDDECVVCYRDEGTDWFHCSGCPKKTHLTCASKWWKHQQRNLQQKTCPHCKKVLDNTN